MALAAGPGPNAEFVTQVLEALPLAVFAKDPNDQFRYVVFNRMAEKVYGLSRDQVLHRTDAEIFNDSRGDQYCETRPGAHGGGGDLEMPETAVGGAFLRVRKTLVRDADGQPWLILGFTEDSSGRMRMETELNRSQESLAKAQALAGIGNWEWQRATDEVLWSDQMFRILGWEPGAVVPSLRRIMERTHPDDRPLFGRSLRRPWWKGGTCRPWISGPSGRTAAPGSSTPSWKGSGPGADAPCACGAPSRTSPSGATPRTPSARPRSWRAWASWPGASPTTSTTCCPPSAATWNWPR